MSESILLEVTDLKRHYRLGGGLFGKARTLKAVDGVSFTWPPAAPWRWWASRAAGNRRWPAW
jgi:ABC-type oligopeptide transport system, ATPase component